MLKGTMSTLFMTEIAVLATISNMKGKAPCILLQIQEKFHFIKLYLFIVFFGFFFLHTVYMNEFEKLYQLATSVIVRYEFIARFIY